MKRKFLCSVMVMVSLALLLSNGVLASSFEEQQIAAAYLKERGIMEGDNNGAMNLESSLTRAELAVILAHLNGDPEHLQTEQERYYKYCQFQDVPEWARVYVGYCYANGLMAGYDTGFFGASDSVTPAAACTVILRYLSLPTVKWDYSTACQAAIDQKLTTAETAAKTEVTRGDLAIMIYRALGNTGPIKSEETSEPSTTKQPNGTLSLPTDGSRYVPKKGDAIACDDGTTYMVTDVSRYGLNPFYSDGKLPEDLPVPSCDWSGFAQPELPSVEVRHFKNSSGDMLFVRNLYETRRMQYTLYNLIGQSDSDATVSLTIDWEIGVGEFWPWRDSEVEKLFYSSPDGQYYVEAWDIYKDGVYQNTRYRIDVR